MNAKTELIRAIRPKRKGGMVSIRDMIIISSIFVVHL